MLLSRLIDDNLRSENSCLCGMNKLKQIQAHSLKNGIDNNHVLILQLLRVPNIPYARNLLVNIPNPTVLLYNLFIKAYSSQNQPQECLSLYSQMCFHGCPPNHHSFTLLFAACTALRSLAHGRRLHTHLIKSGFHSDAFASTALLDTYAKLGMLGSARQVFDEIPVRDIPTWNSMIAGYARCGKLEEALALFEQMPCRSVVSWTAMISGYSQNGQYGNALAMFLNMEKEKTVRPNEVTIASVIPACANLGALAVGKRIEAYARDNGLFSNIYVSNSLLEMYARCGEIEVAWRMFEEIGKRRNLCTWNSMIMGMAVHGRCKEAFELYNQMLREGTSPDDVTIVGLLLACTHGGMVTKGEELFDSMERRFFIIPKLEHYGCMVDLLGRAGKLQKAYDLIERMPMKPDSVVWGTLLGACSFHRNIELGEKAAKSLFKLEPWNPGNYVILSNIYACTGRWDKVAELRKLMKGGQITKAAGSSFIEVGGEVHKFIVEDKSHLRSAEIYALLNEVSTRMRLQRTGADSESEHEELCTMESI